MKNPLNINPQKITSRWVAVNINKKNEIISEGTKPRVVIKKADKTGKSYSLIYVPKPGHSHIF